MISRRIFLAAPALPLAAAQQDALTPLRAWRVVDGPESAFVVDGDEVAVQEHASMPCWLRSRREWPNGTRFSAADSVRTLVLTPTKPRVSAAAARPHRTPAQRRRIPVAKSRCGIILPILSTVFTHLFHQISRGF